MGRAPAPSLPSAPSPGEQQLLGFPLKPAPLPKLLHCKLHKFSFILQKDCKELKLPLYKIKLYEKDVTPTYPKLSDAEHIFLNESPFWYFPLEGKRHLRRIKINKEITDSKYNTAHIIRDKYSKHGWLIEKILENVLKGDCYSHFQ